MPIGQLAIQQVQLQIRSSKFFLRLLGTAPLLQCLSTFRKEETPVCCRGATIVGLRQDSLRGAVRGDEYCLVLYAHFSWIPCLQAPRTSYSIIPLSGQLRCPYFPEGQPRRPQVTPPVLVAGEVRGLQSPQWF